MHSWNPRWPVLRTYSETHLRRIALPLGGIGTGTISLSGRGALVDWEVMNHPAKGFVPTLGEKIAPLFALHCQGPHGAVTKLLEGPIDPVDYEGSHGCRVYNHGWPRFAEATFASAYPLAQIALQDPAVPLEVRLEAMNPLIPADADASGLPFLMLRYHLHNPGAEPLTASITGMIPNFIGDDGTDLSHNVYGQRNRGLPEGGKIEAFQESGLHGLLLSNPDLPADAIANGTLAIASPTSGTLTHRTRWPAHRWGGGILDFHDDFAADGQLTELASGVDSRPVGGLAVQIALPPGASDTITFLISWHFPNRESWTQPKTGCCDEGECQRDRIGNYYSTRFDDARDVLKKITPELERLEERTVRFVEAFCGSDLPEPIKEAALFNLSTLRSQTCFRTPDGHFFGWEGCGDQAGCCSGSCTHVWNYEQATPFLFGQLARSMREVEFRHATNADGLMAYRTFLPLDRALEMGKAAADGQLGCLMKLYRDWQLCGDDDFLRRLWPSARRALEFCWIAGGWDADQDGVMEGCQHNTMDVEYYGPNPQMQGWYLGALLASEAMARHLGESDFADRCRSLYQTGRAWTEAHLFNGEYYEQEIRPPGPSAFIAPGLTTGMGATNLDDPQLQLGPGCLIDQLIGAQFAALCDLEPILDPDQVRTTLRSIVRFNGQTDFRAHFNPVRSFVAGDEAGVLMATYPHGNRPAQPFPYYAEVMTGFEHVLAAHLFQEGESELGTQIVRNIRARYDGRKRNPFDEAECGHHYARAMASWAELIAISGFHYSAVTGTMTFAAAERETIWFWSTGDAWGTCRQIPAPDAAQIELHVEEGDLPLQHIMLRGRGAAAVELNEGKVRVRIPVE